MDPGVGMYIVLSQQYKGLNDRRKRLPGLCYCRLTTTNTGAKWRTAFSVLFMIVFFVYCTQRSGRSIAFMRIPAGLCL